MNIDWNEFDYNCPLILDGEYRSEDIFFIVDKSSKVYLGYYCEDGSLYGYYKDEKIGAYTKHGAVNFQVTKFENTKIALKWLYVSDLVE